MDVSRYVSSNGRVGICSSRRWWLWPFRKFSADYVSLDYQPRRPLFRFRRFNSSRCRLAGSTPRSWLGASSPRCASVARRLVAASVARRRLAVSVARRRFARLVARRRAAVSVAHRRVAGSVVRRTRNHQSALPGWMRDLYLRARPRRIRGRRLRQEGQTQPLRVTDSIVCTR